MLHSLRRGVTWFVPAAAPVVAPLADALRIERRLSGSGRHAAVTFDDGPHPEGTAGVLEALRDAGVRATFFLVGEQVERYPGLAGEIASAGHEIGVHGYRHTLLLRRSPRAVADDLERAVDVLGAATGQSPACYRPPYGVFSSAALEIVRRRGWRPVLWSKWGRDWTRRASVESVASLATRGLGPGDIVLLHDADHYSVADSWRRTTAALPRILEAGEGWNLTWVTLDGAR